MASLRSLQNCQVQFRICSRLKPRWHCLLQGFLQTALVVSSFHVLPKEGHAQTPADTFIRIFYGEGDRYGCWLDIDTRSIVWHALESSLGASVAPAKSGSRQHPESAPI